MFDRNKLIAEGAIKHAIRLSEKALQRELDTLKVLIMRGKEVNIEIDDLEIIALEYASELNKRLKK